MITERQARIRQLIKAIRKSENLSKEVKKAAIQDFRDMYANPDYLPNFSPRSRSFSGMFIWNASKLGHEFWRYLSSVIETVEMFGKEIKELKAGGYNVRVRTDGLNVGCQKVTWEQYDALVKEVKKVRKA